MLERTLFAEEHAIFRESVRRFIAAEIVPNHEGWEKLGHVDRGIWHQAGKAGFLCPSIPEEYGGAGADRLFGSIVIEELARVSATGPGFTLHSEIVAPYILRYGTEDQKRTWLPKMATGEVIGAIAMTEPGAGSDLQGMKTRAMRDGDDFVLNGSKTFITNGYLSDLVIVAAKTDVDAGAKGITLILVEASRDGFTKGSPFRKLGLRAQDTCELFFDNVRVPATNVLGGEGNGFRCLMQELAWERLQIAIGGTALMESILQQTIDYTRDRKAFGRAVADFQATKFKLAELKTEVQIARVFVDRCLELVLANGLSTDTAAMAKYWVSELTTKVVDQCLQLHGGNGFMWEYQVARAYADSRIQRIFGGTNEIMKELISRSL